MRKPRIISGSLKGRTLEVLDGGITRPTMDRTRQAVFNTLLSAPWAKTTSGIPKLHKAHVLDVFSGSGAYGFEALSRGAENFVAIEKHPKAAKLIRDAAEKFSVTDRVDILNIDIRRLPKTDQPCDVIFMDPPYGQGLVNTALDILRSKGYANNDTVLIIEYDGKEDIDGIIVFDEKTYGKSHVTYAKLA